MAPHSSTLAWKIPWTEEPGGLQCLGLRRVGHDWVNSLSLFTLMHWRRKWQPTPVFLPGKPQGRGSLVGCRLWGCTESDTTEATSQQQQQQQQQRELIETVSLKVKLIWFKIIKQMKVTFWIENISKLPIILSYLSCLFRLWIYWILWFRLLLGELNFKWTLLNSTTK